MTDFNVFIFGIVITLTLTLLGMVMGGRSSARAIIPFFAGVIGTGLAVAVLQDGSITEVSGGVVTVIASAASPSVWQFISITLWSIPIAAFMIAMLKAFKMM